MKALILAAGYATRLYQLTREYPKSLLLVKGRPIIDYIADKLKAVKEIDEIIVVTNNKFFKQFLCWQKARKGKVRISVVNDLTRDNSKRLGAIGDMNFAVNKKRLEDDLLVIGGDNLFDGDLRGFLAFARKPGGNPVIGVYDIKKKSEASKYGVVGLNSSKQLIDFKEKPRVARSSLIAMCLYYFPKERLGLIKEYLNSKLKKKDAMGFYIDWLRKEVPVYGYVFSGKWYDIGDYNYYNTAKRNFAK
jgi:glucose-1-phosphate thymidylyltransferase